MKALWKQGDVTFTVNVIGKPISFQIQLEKTLGQDSLSQMREGAQRYNQPRQYQRRFLMVGSNGSEINQNI